MKSIKLYRALTITNQSYEVSKVREDLQGLVGITDLLPLLVKKSGCEGVRSKSS
jgi:hypothetical protein